MWECELKKDVLHQSVRKNSKDHKACFLKLPLTDVPFVLHGPLTAAVENVQIMVVKFEVCAKVVFASQGVNVPLICQAIIGLGLNYFNVIYVVCRCLLSIDNIYLRNIIIIFDDEYSSTI